MAKGRREQVRPPIPAEWWTAPEQFDAARAPMVAQAREEQEPGIGIALSCDVNGLLAVDKELRNENTGLPLRDFSELEQLLGQDDEGKWQIRAGRENFTSLSPEQNEAYMSREAAAFAHLFPGAASGRHPQNPELKPMITLRNEEEMTMLMDIARKLGIHVNATTTSAAPQFSAMALNEAMGGNKIPVYSDPMGYAKEGYNKGALQQIMVHSGIEKNNRIIIMNNNADKVQQTKDGGFSRTIQVDPKQGKHLNDCLYKMLFAVDDLVKDHQALLKGDVGSKVNNLNKEISAFLKELEEVIKQASNQKNSPAAALSYVNNSSLFDKFTEPLKNSLVAAAKKIKVKLKEKIPGFQPVEVPARDKVMGLIEAEKLNPNPNRLVKLTRQDTLLPPDQRQARERAERAGAENRAGLQHAEAPAREELIQVTKNEEMDPDRPVILARKEKQTGKGAGRAGADSPRTQTSVVADDLTALPVKAAPATSEKKAEEDPLLLLTRPIAKSIRPGGVSPSGQPSHSDALRKQADPNVKPKVGQVTLQKPTVKGRGM